VVQAIAAMSVRRRRLRLLVVSLALIAAVAAWFGTGDSSRPAAPEKPLHASPAVAALGDAPVEPAGPKAISTGKLQGLVTTSTGEPIAGQKKYNNRT